MPRSKRLIRCPVVVRCLVAGETWNFQAWFRDKNRGETSNFTNGVSVIFD